MNRDYPLAPTSMPQAISDNTRVKKPYIKTPAKRNAEEKVKIAKDFYESDPVGYKYRKDIVDTAKARLSRIKE